MGLLLFARDVVRYCPRDLFALLWLVAPIAPIVNNALRENTLSDLGAVVVFEGRFPLPDSTIGGGLLPCFRRGCCSSAGCTALADIASVAGNMSEPCVLVDYNCNR